MRKRTQNGRLAGGVLSAVQDREKATKSLGAWKDIAEYLDVSVRTAQKYERNFKLPIHRLPGSKGRVWAEPSELDAWRARMGGAVEQAQLANQPQPDTPPAVVPRRTGLVVIVMGFAAVVIFSTVIWRIFGQSGIATAFRWVGSDLVATDKRGSEIWRHTFPAPPFFGWYEEANSLNIVWHREADIDSDGKVEALLEYLSDDFASQGASLYCFSQDGRVKWVYQNRRKVSDQKAEFSGVYWINNFILLPLDRSRPGRVVVSSNHHVEFPEQVALLDAAGNVLGQYWHSGHLIAMALAENAGDGRPQLYMAGVNNGFRQATLVVLDPYDLRGASKQPPGDPFQFKGMEAGNEKAIVRFPRSCISNLYGPFNIAIGLSVTPSSIDVVVSEDYTRHGPFVTYQLDRSLKVTSARPSVEFKNKHKELESEGKLHHLMTDQEMEQLKQGVAVVR